MHDLLRDMGRHIVREESQRIGERSRLWVDEEILDVLKNNKGVTYTTEEFEKMKYLRLLRLENVYLTGSFQHIFTDLKSLRWQKCPLNCLPSSFEPQNLVVLDLRDSKNLITVWEDALYLLKLKKLNLSRCTELRTPNLTGVKNLKILLLGACSSLEEIHLSIGHLSRLVKLVIDECRMIKSLPNSISNLSSLKHLNLNHSTCSLPASVSGLCSLEYIGISGRHPRDIPNDIGSLSSLKVLNLYWNLFRTMPTSLSQLSSITSLHFSECANLESLPGLPPNMKSLYLYGCKSLESLPALPLTLEYINARGCISLEELPNLGHLQRMTTLIPAECSRLNDIQGLGNLLDIKELDFTGCMSLESLAELPPNLKALYLCGCKSLESLPALLPPTLEYIKARDCISQEKLSNLGHLQRMTKLIIANCS